LNERKIEKDKEEATAEAPKKKDAKAEETSEE
jgi:small subunit ribosomal protein S2